jgi:alanyl-tRNA synthetase
MPVQPISKPREEALAEGAMALFGEKYGETVRTLTIGDLQDKYSYELCGGTHLERTSDVGAFLIVSEGSVATNVRRIEAVTGRGAYELIHKRLKQLRQTAGLLKSGVEEIPAKVEALQDEVSKLKKELSGLRAQQALSTFNLQLSNLRTVKDVSVLAVEIPESDVETLRMLADKFREKHPKNGAAVLATGTTVIAAVTEDVVKRGIKAVDLIAGIGGKGGGRPGLAQGSLPNGTVSDALGKLTGVVESKLK